MPDWLSLPRDVYSPCCPHLLQLHPRCTLILQADMWQIEDTHPENHSATFDSYKHSRLHLVEDWELIVATLSVCGEYELYCICFEPAVPACHITACRKISLNMRLSFSPGCREPEDTGTEWSHLADIHYASKVLKHAMCVASYKFPYYANFMDHQMTLIWVLDFSWGLICTSYWALVIFF